MIKFLMTNEQGRRVLGIMLTKDNVDRMMEELPIHFHAEEMNLPVIGVEEVAIFYFETTLAATQFLASKGLITADTIVETQVETSIKH